MSRAFIAEYFDYAKKRGNDLAVGFYQDKKISWIPHWLIRSKAKHFALGLLELNVPPQGFFYLLPHHHPEWIYSMLAGQSLGLATVAIPPWLSIAELEKWMEQYPPSLVYGGTIPTESRWKIFKKQKSILTYVLGGPGEAASEDFVSSFRKIHNRGIMVESKFYEQYRQRRESLTKNQLLSPVQVDASHQMREVGLRSNDLPKSFQTLEARLREKKATQLFAEVDLSRTMDQLVALYWPLQTGRKVLLAQGQDHWLGLRPGYRPHLAFLSPTGVSALAGFLPLGKTPLLQKTISFWVKRRARKKLGGNLQEIWSTGPLGEETTTLFKKLGITSWTVEL